MQLEKSITVINCANLCGLMELSPRNPILRSYYLIIILNSKIVICTSCGNHKRCNSRSEQADVSKLLRKRFLQRLTIVLIIQLLFQCFTSFQFPLAFIFVERQWFYQSFHFTNEHNLHHIPSKM